MSKVTLEAVQKIFFHLDVPYPSFPTWKETLEFVVDDVIVKAVATHSWRYINIQIIEPFDIQAWSFEPPLIALGVSMLHRQACLTERKITDSEDCLLRTKAAYLRHVAYLRLQPRIEANQTQFARVFDSELMSLLSVSQSVRSRVDLEKKEESKKFKSGQIDQKIYQANLQTLETQARNTSEPYYNLKFQVDRELLDIKHSMIDAMLADDAKHA